MSEPRKRCPVSRSRHSPPLQAEPVPDRLVFGPLQSEQFIRRRPRTQQRRQARIREPLDEIAALLAADHNLVVIEVESEPDDLGRQQLVTHWWGHRVDLGPSAYGHRGQVFFTNLEQHKQSWVTEHGKTVQVREST